MSRKQASEETRKIEFEITTMTPLPVGEQVFISGNVDGLGNWNPSGFPLARMDDFVWSAPIMLPAGKTIEYKITRGSWDTEETLADETIPENHELSTGRDRVVKHQVHHWKDHGMSGSNIAGEYRVHDRVSSLYLRHDRRVIVWLPPSYEQEPDRRYPVVYMHDGQQVFDPATSTWNQDWEVDEWCTKLIDEDRLNEIIVVGIYSTDDRFVEYNPSQLGKEYTRFVIEELKPWIDKEYRTLPDRDHTLVAGASLGGSISFYMAWTHPDVFFGAACLSPAFRFNDDQLILDLVGKADTVPDLTIYLYCGQGDELERKLITGMREMAGLLKSKGMKKDRLLVAEDPRAEHNEAAWARHTDHWLLYFFGK